MNMRIGLVHATTTAIEPIERAFRAEGNPIQLLHFTDTGLLEMMEKKGSLTPDIIRRFSSLLNLAEESQVGCIQLTCSAFNDITDILQPMYQTKLFRSDEAMLDEALGYEKIGLVSTVRETPIALSKYLRKKRPSVHIESVVKPGLIHLLSKGMKKEHDIEVCEMVSHLDGKVDVIVLSQYSLEHIADLVQSSVPVLTAPKATVKRCISYLQKRSL